VGTGSRKENASKQDPAWKSTAKRRGVFATGKRFVKIRQGGQRFPSIAVNLNQDIEIAIYFTIFG
jgi:hypothetical protein